jgi:hypothetical protein
MPVSGANWARLYPTSSSLTTLEPTFQLKVSRFLDALSAAGATVDITATRRPRQRAYLMHYSWCIVKQWHGLQPASVPAFKPGPGETPIDIQWQHMKPGGHPDPIASQVGAQAMVRAYAIARLKVPPALKSNHIAGLAIDMQISWNDALTLKDATGTAVTISSLPRSGMNPDLIKVGASYGVIHLHRAAADPVHWSVDGR